MRDKKLFILASAIVIVLFTVTYLLEENILNLSKSVTEVIYVVGFISFFMICFVIAFQITFGNKNKVKV